MITQTQWYEINKKLHLFWREKGIFDQHQQQSVVKVGGVV